MSRVIGVLALQGAFQEHADMLRRLGAEPIEIRNKEHLENGVFDGLILPGGESTVMGKLLKELGMFDILVRKIQEGLPVLGTCAGLILLAKEVLGEEDAHLATMDITVTRNAYGRQLGSFHTEQVFKSKGQIPMTFIRAPYIDRAGEQVEILSVVGGHIVAARQGNMIVTSFHPELTEDPCVHQYFLDSIQPV